MLAEYRLDEAPFDVISDVNRHSPYKCKRCGTLFDVEVLYVAKPRALSMEGSYENANNSR